MFGRLGLWLVLATASGSAAFAEAAGDASDAEPAKTLADVVYASTPERDLHLDFYLNRAAIDGAGPAIVYFHGGGWSHGAPPNNAGGFRSYMRSGFSVVTVEYRLAGEAPAPAAVQDARCALHWLKEHAQTLHIDPARIVVIGTSAGGHLALMAGLLPQGSELDPPSCGDVPKPAAIIDMYGPTDLTKLTSPSGGRNPMVVRWTGDGKAGERLERLLSPVRYVTGESPPVFVVHGDADPIVLVEQAELLAKRLDETGVRHEMVIVPGGGHGKFGADEKMAVQSKIESFLKQLEIIP